MFKTNIDTQGKLHHNKIIQGDHSCNKIYMKNWHLHFRCWTAIISDLPINLQLSSFFNLCAWIERQWANNLLQAQRTYLKNRLYPKYREISSISQSNLFPHSHSSAQEISYLEQDIYNSSFSSMQGSTELPNRYQSIYQSQLLWIPVYIKWLQHFKVSVSLERLLQSKTMSCINTADFDCYF